ncbi:MAG: hypothetical protein ACLTF6_05035 [Clostridium sp.]
MRKEEVLDLVMDCEIIHAISGVGPFLPAPYDTLQAQMLDRA